MTCGWMRSLVLSLKDRTSCPSDNRIHLSIKSVKSVKPKLYGELKLVLMQLLN
jgi:hypothetical protein